MPLTPLSTPSTPDTILMDNASTSAGSNDDDNDDYVNDNEDDEEEEEDDGDEDVDYVVNGNGFLSGYEPSEYEFPDPGEVLVSSPISEEYQFACEYEDYDDQ